MTSCLRDKNNENKLKSDISDLADSYVNSFKLSPKDIKTHKILKNLHKTITLLFLNLIKAMG